MDTEINWQLLGRAVTHYRMNGFEYVETPWYVPPETAMITRTKPEWGVSACFGMNGAPEELVGSAEQGFLEQVIQHRLKPGRYVSCGPCFRNEENPDNLHQKTFMKVELFQNLDTTDTSLEKMIKDAFMFMSLEADRLNDHLEIAETDVGYDINLNGVEVGSYGLRTARGITWAYGTGLAEPRFSMVSKKDRLNAHP